MDGRSYNWKTHYTYLMVALENCSHVKTINKSDDIIKCENVPRPTNSPTKITYILNHAIVHFSGLLGKPNKLNLNVQKAMRQNL